MYHPPQTQNFHFFILLLTLPLFSGSYRSGERVGAVVVQYGRVGNGLPQRELERPILAIDPRRLNPAIRKQDIQLSGNIE